MAQSQFGSVGINDGNTLPDLAKKDLIKEMIDPKVKANRGAAKNSSSVLKDASISFGKDGCSDAPEPAPNVDTGIQDMKTADTAGDGIIATSSSGSTAVMEPAPMTETKSVECAAGVILPKRIELALTDAARHSKMFEMQRIQRHAEREISDIESGRRRFNDSVQRDTALEAAREKKAAADVSLKQSGPPRYAQTLKKLHDVTRAIENFYKTEFDPSMRDTVLNESIHRLEELMHPIDNIWNGIPGKTPDLPRPGNKADKPIWAEERLPQIQAHLEAKINTVDGAQAQRVGVVKDNPIVKELLSMHSAGELPKDGSIIFFTDESMLLYQYELKVSQRSTLARAKDAASAERHANNTPAFIDVNRLDQGIGPEGAGLWRFIGQENRIVGAALLKPVLKDGKPVELPGARNNRGEPMVKKEVSLVLGTIPPEVSVTMAYGHLLNTLRAKKLAAEKCAMAETECTSDSQSNGNKDRSGTFNTAPRVVSSTSRVDSGDSNSNRPTRVHRSAMSAGMLKAGGA